MTANKRDNKIKGRAGETTAGQFLVARGHQIVAQNFSCLYGEVDLITVCAQVLHFVEVKSRTGDLVPGRCAVNIAKQRRIKKVAGHFLNEYPAYQDFFVSFDVVEITGDKVEYLENCFY